MNILNLLYYAGLSIEISARGGEVTRRGNSGVSWDPSSQKIFELAENIWQNAHAKL